MLAGNLSSVSLLEALRLLAVSSQTGVLRLTGAVGGRVYLRAGLVTSAELDGSGSLGAAPGRDGGAAGSGGSGGGDVGEGIAGAQIMDVIFELLVLGGGDFEFVAGLAVTGGSRVNLEVEAVVAEQERRLREWKQIAALMPAMSATPTIAARLGLGAHDVVITRDEWQVLALLDGRSSVAAVLSSSGLRPVDACRALYGLMIKDLVGAIA